jgi:hypothetical protein
MTPENPQADPVLADREDIVAGEIPEFGWKLDQVEGLSDWWEVTVGEVEAEAVGRVFAYGEEVCPAVALGA